MHVSSALTGVLLQTARASQTVNVNRRGAQARLLDVERAIASPVVRQRFPGVEHSTSPLAACHTVWHYRTV